jgi:hypothetical protein
MNIIIVCSIHQLVSAIEINSIKEESITILWRSKDAFTNAENYLNSKNIDYSNFLRCDNIIKYLLFFSIYLMKSQIKPMNSVIIGDKRSFTNAIFLWLKSDRFFYVSDGAGDDVSENRQYINHSNYIGSIKAILFKFLPVRNIEKNSLLIKTIKPAVNLREAYFIGQCLSEKHTLTLEREISLLIAELANKDSLKWSYIAHPKDSENKLHVLAEKVEGLNIIRPKISLEFYLMDLEVIPHYYLTFYSTAALLVSSMSDEVECRFSEAILPYLSQKKVSEVVKVYELFKSKGVFKRI